MAELDADVILLQEAWSGHGQENLAKRLGAVLGFEVAYARANGSRRLLGFEEGVAVLSRFPLSNHRLLDLGPRKHLFDRRVALSVDVVLPSGDPLAVVTTHLTNEAPNVSEAQALDLVDQLDAAGGRHSALLLAGDLNDSEQSKTLRHLSDAGWIGVAHGHRDHLLIHDTSSHWRGLWNEWVEGTIDGSPSNPVSDPRAILAELEPAGAPSESRWRGAWDVAIEASLPGSAEDQISQTVELIGQIEGVESVLVVHDGLLVAERYFRGATPERLQNMKSASKGVLSALVGIAIDQGHLALDDPISDYLPERYVEGDPRKDGITVRHLLGMTSGLESTSFGAYGSWASSRNLVQNALARPLLATPGTTFAYSTGSTHLLSAVLTAATGQSSLDFARQHLFEPLGIEGVVWERDRQGIYLGGNNMAMRSRDMARFGLLYLDRGRWGDHQVVPWSFVDQSTVVQHSWSSRFGGGYGYLWWIRHPEERGAYTASGFGGQYIFISRADDLVVVINSTEVSKGRGWRGELFSAIREGIVEPVRTTP